MQRDTHFESDTHARVVRLPLSDGPPPEHVEIDDAQFLFTAHFKKSGPDLILTGDNGQKLVLVDYFNLAKRPDLTSHGATMSADLVARLAGPDAPGQYAQVGAPAGAQVIGKCERIGGGATVQHANGVVEELKVGDVILKGDVVMTNDGSSAVLSLVDGTVFNMGASARMVLSELLYDASSTSNSALVSLVKGSFTFVAGQVAHTGDMKVDTPVMTVGIRGTTVGAYCEADPSGIVVDCTTTLLTDPGGGVGRYDVLDRVTGAVLYSMTSTGVQANFRIAANNQVQVQETAKSPAQVQQEIAAAQILFPVYQAVQATIVQPQGPQTPQSPQSPQQQNPNPPNNSLAIRDQQPQAAQEVTVVNVVADTSNTTRVAVQELSVVNNLVQPIVSNQTAVSSSPLIAAPSPLQQSAVVTIDPFTNGEFAAINRTTAQAGVTISGTVTGLGPGTQLAVTIADGSFSRNYAATVDQSGSSWKVVIPSADALALPNGTLAVTAKVADQSGNQSVQATQTFTVAETLPTLTIDSVTAGGNKVINHDAGQNGVTLSGTITGLAAGATFPITVTDGAFSKIYTATVSTTGTGWTATIPSNDTTALANGTATVTAQVTDPYGNQSSPATQNSDGG